ncbi:hypothetical protein, partial, partial [Absidia glauca]
LFSDLGDQLDVCPLPCTTAKQSHVSIASISDIIASKLYHPATRNQLMYRSNRRVENNATTDIFDGVVSGIADVIV